MQREPRASLSPGQRLALDGYVLDLERGELLDAAGRPTDLRAQALKVLLVLGEHAGQVVGKDTLMRRVWGDVIVTEDSLVQAIGDIRRVIGDAGHARVRTVPRRGYLLTPDVPAAAALAPLDRPLDRPRDGPHDPPLDPPVVPAAVPPAVPHVDPPARAPDATAAPNPRAGHIRAWPALIGASVLVAALGLGGWLARSAPPAPPRSLAILPFQSDAGTDDWFVEGVGGDLTTLVGSWPEVRLIGRGTMAAYKGQDPDPRQVARDLGVRHVLSGRARRDGDRVRLAVSLVDAEGAIVWSEQRDVPRAELGALVGDVAGGIARALAVPFGDAVAIDARRLAPAQAQADDLALQGVAELLRGVSKPNFERARQLFEHAVALDPSSRRGLGGVTLANANLLLWEWADDPPAARARAAQALAQLDVVAPEALITKLAHASMANVRRDWSGLLAIGDRLAELHPNEPTSHHHRCSALLRLARFDESIEACRRAMRISPRDSRVPTWQGLIGFNEFQLGRLAAAEKSTRESVLANPRVPFYSVVLAASLAEQGRREEAAAVIDDVKKRHPTYRTGTLTHYWMGTEPRFLAGRDRIARAAAELGLDS